MSVTEAPIPGGDAPGIRSGRGPAPEVVGAALAVIVLAVVGTSLLAGGSRPVLGGPTPTPIASRPPVVATVAPIVDPAVVSLLRALNGELVTGAQSLQRELDRASFRTADVASLIRQLNARVAYGGDVVRQLGGALGPDQPGGKLAALYDDIGTSASDTLGASLQNVAAYRVGAGALVKLIDGIPALQEAIEALLHASPAPVSSASPPPSSAAPGTPTPSQPPAITPAPSKAPASPSARASTGPPAGDERLVNGDFETSGLAPWHLLVGGGASATVTADTVNPASGKTSARIDIATSSAAYSGISFQQGGLQLQAGGQYTLALSTRATTGRDVRVRISSLDDASYLTRLVTVGPAWAPSTFTFTAPVTDPNAVLEIELGRSMVTTWIDAVSFRPAGVGP